MNRESVRICSAGSKTGPFYGLRKFAGGVMIPVYPAQYEFLRIDRASLIPPDQRPLNRESPPELQRTESSYAGSPKIKWLLLHTTP